VKGDQFVRDHVVADGVFEAEFKTQKSEGRLYRHLTQPSRNIILSRNAELRKNPGSIKDLSFGRFHLSIPLIDYEVLKVKYPVLKNGSNAERTAFYKRFIRSTESIPFRVQ